MADKPSRALVFYGDRLIRFIEPAHTHLHSFASRALCGFLSLPNAPPSEIEGTRIIREIAQLLDSHEGLSEDQENSSFPTIAERFMGMKTAIVTRNSSLKRFGDKLGVSTFQWEELFNNFPSSPPNASGLLSLLGLENGKALDTNHFDLVFVHVGLDGRINSGKDAEFLNNLVGELLQTAQSEPDVCSRLHMSIVVGFGSTYEDDQLRFSVHKTEPKNNGGFPSLIPCQSYMMKGGKPRENVRQFCPLLLAQHQNGVTRKDMVEKFSFKDFAVNGGNLVIPADRFLHEVAFKLWKAPKYGA